MITRFLLPLANVYSSYVMIKIKYCIQINNNNNNNINNHTQTESPKIKRIITEPMWFSNIMYTYKNHYILVNVLLHMLCTLSRSMHAFEKINKIITVFVENYS